MMQQELVTRELTGEGVVRTRKVGARGAGTKRSSVTVNIAESPLTWLHAHGHLEDRLFEAGERLRADFERAQLGPSITMSWSAVRIRGTGDQGLSATERQIAAKRRFDEACVSAGKGLQDILWRVVCSGETLPVAEKALDWPARSGKLVLKLALERVAEYYRIR
jgi:hypothetical protein